MNSSTCSLGICLPRKNIRVSYPESSKYFAIIYLFFFGLIAHGFPILWAIDFFGSKALSESEWVPLCLGWIVIVIPYTFFLRSFLFRLLPGPVKIIAVKVIEIRDQGAGAITYIFNGGSIAKVLLWTSYMEPHTNRMVSLEKQQHNVITFDKPHRILWLDKPGRVAFAAELQRGGGAVLLDEYLRYLQLDQTEKTQLLAALRTQQAKLTADRSVLDKLIQAIPASGQTS